MATSGVISSIFNSGYKIQIDWVVNSQSVTNNTSNITVKAQLVSTSSSYTINSTATKSGSLTINGTAYNFSFTAGLSGNQTKTVFTKTLDISHGSDGNKTCSMSCDLGINVTLSGTYYGTVNTSGSGVFNLIPRTSTFTLTASSVTLGTTAQKIDIQSASASFKHKITYKIGSNSWVKTPQTTDYVATTYTFTPAIGDCEYLPTSTSGTATIVVDTYSGTTLIGSNSKTFTITVPSSVIPTFTSVTATGVDAGASPATYGYVQGKSKSTLTITGALGAHKSTIAAYSITGGGFSSTASSYTTGVLNTSGDIIFTAKVQDSRGRWSATKTVTINVKAYVSPSITTYTALRCLSSGTLDDDGTYVKATSTYTYSTLGTLNTLTTKVEYRKTGATTWINGGALVSGALTTGGGTILVDSSYEVKLTITDKFISVTKTLIIPTSFMTMDFKKGGKGVAIGKAAEYDNFDVGIPANFKNGITSDSNKYWLSNGEYAVDLQNSDIIGANNIFFNDQLEGSGEGIQFLRTGASSDSRSIDDYTNLRGLDGELFWQGDNFNLNGNSRLDATGGSLRMYTSKMGSADYGLRLDKSGVMSLIVNNVTMMNVSTDGNTEIGTYDSALYSSYRVKRDVLGINGKCHIGINNIDNIPVLGSELWHDDVLKSYTHLTSTAFRPMHNILDLGHASYKWKTLYAVTGTINTSDRNEKQQIATISDEVLNAWSEVNYCQFKYNDSVAEKGDDNARFHTGLIAQEIEEAFIRHGLNAFDYGMLCYDEWDDQYNEYGTLERKAGSLYSIRADECQFMEMALQRRETERLKLKIQQLEELLNI